MAIKGLTDGAGRLMVAGKLSIGEKVTKKLKDGREIEIPAQSDHFRFLVKNTENDKWCVDEEKTAQYGTPREVKIMFLTSQIDEIFQTNLKYHVASSKLCSGNGETATRFLDFKPGESPKNAPRIKKQIQCSLDCPDYLSKKCKAVGDLYFILAEKITLGSCYLFSTSSTKSTQQILASLQQLYAATSGNFAGIPLSLKMVPVTNSYTDKDGNQQKSTAWTVFLELTAKDFKEFGKMLGEQVYFKGKMLPAPLQGNEELEHYSEFFPETEELIELNVLKENAEMMVKQSWVFSDEQKTKRIASFQEEKDSETLKNKMNAFQEKMDLLNDAVKAALKIGGIGTSEMKVKQAVCKNIGLLTMEDSPESFAMKILQTEKTKD